jgi:hypothetical protein
VTRVVLRIERLVLESASGGDAPSPGAVRAALEEALRAELDTAIGATAEDGTPGGPVTSAALARVAVDAGSAAPGPLGRAVLAAVRSATGGWPGSDGGVTARASGPVPPPAPASAHGGGVDP